MDYKIGDICRLRNSINGYTKVELLEKYVNMWFCRVCGSGLRIKLYEDEFYLE